jgi:hypothetical protein
VLALKIVVEFEFKGGGIKGGGSLKEEAIRRRREFKRGGNY